MSKPEQQPLDRQLRALAREIAAASDTRRDALTALERASARISAEPLSGALDRVCRRIRQDHADPREAILEHPDVFPTELRQAFDLWLEDGDPNHFSAWLDA